MHIALPRSLLALAITALAATPFGAMADCTGLPGTGGGGSMLQGAQYIVGFKSPATKSGSGSRSQALLATASLTGLEARRVREMADGSEVIRIDGKDRAEVARAAARMASRNDVAFVVEDRIVRMLAAPNDPLYASQWSLKDTNAGIRAEAAWSLSQGNQAVIAVLDTGITAHPDLQPNVLGYGYDFVSDANIAADGDARDSNASDPGDFAVGECTGATTSSWHGTKVAGIAAAVRNNSQGIAGVAPMAKILPVRVLGKGGQGQLSDVADAIRWAAGGTVPGVPTLAPNQVADVINLSLGWTVPAEGSPIPPACSPVEQSAIDFAIGQGVLVVAAAGNNNGSLARISPASCSGVIAVAASDVNGVRAIYSGTGLGSSASNRGSAIDVTAPGKDNQTTSNGGFETPGLPSYAPFSGTSAAAPHVSGVIAMMQALSPRTPDEVMAILKATDRPQMTCSGCNIPGPINAEAALAALAGSAPPVASFAPTKLAGCKAPFAYRMNNSSTDPDNDITSVQWTLGAGLTSTDWDPSAKLDWNETRTFSLVVTDSRGASSSKAITVTAPGGCTY